MDNSAQLNPEHWHLGGVVNASDLKSDTFGCVGSNPADVVIFLLPLHIGEIFFFWHILVILYSSDVCFFFLDREFISSRGN